jgi:hypothetical protein
MQSKDDREVNFNSPTAYRLERGATPDTQSSSSDNVGDIACSSKIDSPLGLVKSIDKSDKDEIASLDGPTDTYEKLNHEELEKRYVEYRDRVVALKMKGNGLKGVKRDESNFKRGVVTTEWIIRAFESVRKDADRVNVYYDHDEDRFIKVNGTSRWSSDPWKYQRKVKRDLEEQTQGLRSLTMLTLTFDRKRLRTTPEFAGWTDKTEQGMDLFIIRHLSDYLGRFLDRLKKYRKRKKLKWNFVSWAFELWNKAGDFHPHIHIIFFGGYVAPLDVLKEYWIYSDPNQVDVKPMRNNNVAGYIVKYVGKGLDRLCRKGYEIYAAFIWYFKRRLYAVRPGFVKVACNKEKRNLVFVGYQVEGGSVLLLKKFRGDFAVGDDVANFDDLPAIIKQGAVLC